MCSFPATGFAATGSACDVRSKLMVPSGHHLLLKAKAAGVQIYGSVADQQGKLKWAWSESDTSRSAHRRI